MDIGAAHPVIRSLPLVALALSIPAQIAAAETKALDLPAGRIGEVIAVLAKQTGASVSVSDRAIWTMRVAALRGRTMR